MANDAHAGNRQPQELLYDANIPTLTHAERALTLVSMDTTGTLSTLAHSLSGFPYGSFVAYALVDNAPVFLISELAEHTKNLHKDPRASLLVVESADKNALANGRVTLLGRCECLREEEKIDRIKQTYISAHPSASYYLDFKDFSFWQLSVEAVRYIGGFGRMSWVSWESWLEAQPDPIAPFAKQILAHMNQDHATTLIKYCKAFSRAHDTSVAVMTSIDRYGFEMSATIAAGQRPVRVAFPSPIETAADARAQLVKLSKLSTDKIEANTLL